MKKTLCLIFALCATGVLIAQEETTPVVDLNDGKKASFHAFINAGAGGYYMGNGNSNLKGPEKNDGIYSLTLVSGAQIGDRFFLGIGLSFESLMTARGSDSSNNPKSDYKPGSNIYYGFPVYIDSRLYLNKNKSRVAPYIMLDVGYEAWRNDPDGVLKHDIPNLWQNCFYFNGGFGVRVGRYFDWCCTAGLRDVQMRFGVEL